MLVNFLVSFGGILIFLFIFWKRLREDYSPGIIFEAAFYILVGITVSQFVSFRFFPGWFFWAGLVGIIPGLYLGIRRFRIRFYEFLETAVISLLPWLSFVFLRDSVGNSSLSSFLVFLATLIIIFIFYYIDTHFREFTWYKSGKVGFAGLSTLAIIFICRSAIALAGANVLSFAGKYEAVVSGGTTLICLALLYNLSRKIG